jgi:hypothetical protein
VFELFSRERNNMDAAAFVDKWRRSRRSERSAAQEHFSDLREVDKHPKPGAVDPNGLTYSNERWVEKEQVCWRPGDDGCRFTEPIEGMNCLGVRVSAFEDLLYQELKVHAWTE